MSLNLTLVRHATKSVSFLARDVVFRHQSGSWPSGAKTILLRAKDRLATRIYPDGSENQPGRWDRRFLLNQIRGDWEIISGSIDTLLEEDNER